MRQESAPLSDQKHSPEAITASLVSNFKVPGTDLLYGITTCLLKTTISEVRSGINRCMAQILFNKGAEGSL